MDIRHLARLETSLRNLRWRRCVVHEGILLEQVTLRVMLRDMLTVSLRHMRSS